MRLSLDVALEYRMAEPADLLLQVEAAHGYPGQAVIAATTTLSPDAGQVRITGHDAIGERIWVPQAAALSLAYRAEVVLDRPAPPLASLAAAPLAGLPAEVVQYLFPSRYCPVEPFQRMVESEFGDSAGGMRISRIVEFIAGSFAYDPMASDGETCALDSYVRRAGVCRDYAHVLIAMARASAIPARMASAYAPRTVPQDFHAVAEVYLDGGWQLIDATGMAEPGEIAVIGVGRDAADIAFLTAFGAAELIGQRVCVSAIGEPG